MRNRNQKGFTLIELLIVIAIIGILAAVLIPNLLGARNLAQDRAAQAYGAQVYTAINAYLAADPVGTLEDVDCGGDTVGYEIGAFKVSPPGTTVESCVINGDASDFGVLVKSANGVPFKFGNVEEEEEAAPEAPPAG